MKNKTTTLILIALTSLTGLAKINRDLVRKDLKKYDIKPTDIKKEHANGTTKAIRASDLQFVENVGQITDQNSLQRKDIKFRVAAGDLNIFIGSGAVHYQFSKPVPNDHSIADNTNDNNTRETKTFDMYRMDVELIGANRNAEIIRGTKCDYTETYYSDLSDGNGKVASSYKRVVFKNVYPKIDWILYVNGNKLKHEFLVHRGGSPADIKLKYSGSDKLFVDEKGMLIASTKQGTITEEEPVSYLSDGKKVATSYVLKGTTVSYNIAAFNGELTIDPGIGWATYYGGTGDDRGKAIGSDESNNVYMGGHTESTSNIATSGTYQTTYNAGTDGFIVKFNVTGTRMWATYFGGSGTDVIDGVRIDKEDTARIYICGTTTSTSGIATSGASSVTHGGGSTDGFVARLNKTGQIVWATYLGGSAADSAKTMTIDYDNNIYVGGYTASSASIATSGAHQTSFGGGTSDGFIIKYDSSGNKIWGTYYGGSGVDVINALDVDIAGNVLMAGATTSTAGIATTGTQQTSLNSGYDFMVAKFRKTGTRAWGTYYGGATIDIANAISTSPLDTTSIFVIGQSNSSGLASPGAAQGTNSTPNPDAFLLKLNASGVRQWATYMGGGTNTDYGTGTKVDSAGDVYMVGYTNSSGNIVTSDALIPAYNGTAGGPYFEIFVQKYNGSTGSRIYGSYYGGTDFEIAYDMAIDHFSNVYITGYTLSTSSVATTGAHQTAFGGTKDAFIVKFSFGAPITGNFLTCVNGTTTLSNLSPGGTWSSTNPAVATIGSTSGIVTGISSGTTIISYIAGSYVTKIVTVQPVPTITSISPASAKPSDALTITGTSFDANTSSDVVYLGATRALVNTATSTSLSVSVPSFATFGLPTLRLTGCNSIAVSPTCFFPSYDNTGYAPNTLGLNAKYNFPSGTTPHMTQIGDIDGDGKADLLVANNQSNSISIYRNTSTPGSVSSGTFAAKVDITTATNPYSVKIFDIDADGKQDIIVTNTGSNSVSVFRNIGTAGSITAGSFAAKVDFTTGASPTGLAIDDIDGDGRPELLVTNFSANTLSVFRNTSTAGSISFAAKVDFTTGTNPRWVTTGDIDGNDMNDVVVTNTSSNTVSVFRNTAASGSITASSLATKVDLTTGSSPGTVVIVDIDGGSNSDIVVGNYGSNSISIIKNNATSGSITTGSFAAKVDYTTGAGPFEVTIGDINGDGKPDIITGNSSANTLSILRNTATTGTINASSIAAKIDYTTNTTPYFVSVGDLDGDDLPDIVVSNAGSDNISIFRNNPLENNTGTASVCVGATTTLSNSTTGGTWSSSNTSIATVNSSTGIVTGVASGSVNISYNHTGNPVVTSVTVNALPTITASNISICNGSSGTLTAGGASTYFWAPATGLSATTGTSLTASPTVTTTYTVTGTNANGCVNSNTVTVTVNSIPTITASSAAVICQGASTTLTGSGGTTYTWAPSSGLSGTTGTSVTATPTVATTYTVTGTTLGCSSTATVSVTFATPPTITSVSPLIGYPASSVTITGTNFQTTAANNTVFFGATLATVNSATSTSLTVTVPTGATYAPVTVNRTSCNLTALSPRQYLPSYNNNPFVATSVNLNTKVDFTTGSSPFVISIGDLDGDGKSDMVVANYTSNTISVLRNTGTSGSISSGSFAAKVDYTTGSSPYSVRIADIDGNGKRDLIVANTGSNTVSVFRNLSTSGTLSFATKIDFATGANPNAVIVDDFDGDGLQDLATANFGASTISILRNTSIPGAVSFAAKVDFTSGTTPRILTSGDIDGDGKTDITVSNSGGTTLSVLRNTSTPGTISAGSFAAKVDFTVGTTPTELSLVDIDGDGKSDLVVINNSLISVLRNTSTSGAITTGSFAAKQDFTAGTNAFGIGIGDINGDGKPDVVVGNASANTFSIFINTASSGSITSGSFASKVDVVTNSTPFFVAVGDLDGDSKPDIVATNSGSTNLSIFRNDPINKNTGTATTCIGSTTTLSNASTGGTWSSSNTTVATVGSGTGVVAGLTAGTAVITYTVSGISATTIVTINPLPTISGLSATTICTGSNTNLSVTGAATYSWLPATSLSAGTGASVTASPTVTTTYTVTGIDTNGCSSSSSAIITVITIPTVAGITGNGTVCSGQTTTLSSTTGGGTWTSSSTATGSVSTSGVVTGVAAGAFTITYSVTNSCGTGSTTKAMLGYWTPTIGVSVGSDNSCVGATTTYSASPTTGYAWTSSNNAVATINSGGTLMSIATGTTTISYTHTTAGCYTTAIQTVNTVPSFSITTPVCATTSQTLNGTPAGGVWSSSNTGVATIGSTSGIINTTSAGSTSIQYTNGPCSAGHTLSVSAMPGTITGVTTICNGSTTQLTSGTASQTWSSNNTAVATVTTINSTTAVVSGISSGTAAISYSNSSGCSQVATVTISAPIGANSGVTLLCIGQSASLTNATSGGVWTSATPAIATINSSTGVINPLTAGTATMTYTTTSPASCQATTTVTVDAALPAITGSTTVCVGATTTLSNATGGGTWSSSNGNASVGSTTGIVTGASAGTASITYYRSGACFKITTVTVNPVPATISGTLALCESASATTLTCTTSGGSWISGNSSIATIGSASGTVTPISAGAATISYKLITTGCMSTAQFTVNPTPAAFSLSLPACTGTTTSLSTTPTGGSWTSSVTGVATIGSSSGILTGVTAGTTDITYTLSTGCSRTETKTVNTTPAAISGTLYACEGATSTLTNSSTGGTWLSSNTTNATIGSSSGVVSGISSGTTTITYQITATGCNVTSVFTINAAPSSISGTKTTCIGATTTLANTITGGTWTSSDTAVATVGSANGIVTGATTGTSAITYTLPTGCFTTTVVTVNTSSVLTGSLSICDGTSTTLSATPSSGQWSSGTPSVAIVDSISGVVTGITGGTSNITFTNTNGCRAYLQVTVTAIMGTSISGPSGVCNGSTVTMSHLASGGIWSCSDTTKAIIDPATGALSALSVGSVTISYSLGTTCSNTKWVAIQYQPVPITGITTICNGSYSVLYSTVGGSGTWSSADTTIAYPNLTSGMISGLSVGTTTITYRIPASGCQVTTTVDVVNGPAAITGSLFVCQGSTSALASATSGGTWSVSNEGVATVDAAGGVITGVSAGYATISYTLSTGCRATAEVTVNNLPATITGTLALCLAGTTTLSSAPAGGTWASGDASVATISSAGVVTPVSIGTTTITYTVSSSCIRTTVVTVNSAPPAITGEGTVCVGSNTTLTNSSSGGTWMSGTTAKATVGLTTGLVSGVSTGTAVISYIVDGLGCFTTSVQTINATPAAITGTLNACVGESSTLSHAITGGTWSSGNTSIATVDVSGVVTAVSAGYAMITYQTSPSCWVTASFNSKALPAAISGTPYACVGTTTTLASITTAGTWTSSNTTSATINLTSGVLTGNTTGTTLVTYKLSTGCLRTTEVTVNAAPATISGPSALCRTASTTLTCTPTGGTWISSTPAAATINSATGELTGVAAGTTRITYTQAVTGCRSVKTMTIGAPPAAIAGTLSTCAGSATTLTDATTGGTWSSSDVSTATIGSSTGVATAVTTGTATISYNHSGGCVVTAVLTVTPAVGATSGDATLCVGGTTTLANSAGGGTWVSSTTAKATVGAATGIVSGIATGTATITYKVNPSCFNTSVVTVSATPTAISGPAYVCINTDGSFTHAVSGGTWSSSNPAVGSIDGSTGVLRGITAGAVVITYVSGNGCFVTKSVNIANNPPAISGNLAVCAASSSALTCIVGGSATWSSSNTAVGTIGSTSGMLAGLAAGTTTVTYRLNTTGCYSTATATINPLPASISGSNTICAGSTQTYSSTTTGGTWTSSNASAASIGSTSGTATGISAGVITLSYTVSTGCRTTKTVTVNSLPAAITGTSSYCVGGSATLASATTGGTWSSDNAAATVAGSGTVTATTAGTSVISYTLATGCARYATVTVNTALPANTGNNSICAGGSTTLANTSGGGTWASSATTKATVGSASGIVTGVATGTANISFIKSGAGCISVTQVTVNAALAAITGTANACVGASSTLAHTISGGTWSSSNTAMATVDASSGVVSGISAGTPVITYTASPGCYKTANFTVKALPSAITGNGSVCTGSATVLSGSPTGGTWASGNTTIATINTTTGALNGVTVGTVAITYKGANGCYISTTRTVNASPASITGSFTAAVGGSRTLSNTTPSGAWTSSNSAIASVTSATGVVTGIATGSALITYTVPNGCFKSATFTVTAAKDELMNELTDDAPTVSIYPNPTSRVFMVETNVDGIFRLNSLNGTSILLLEITKGVTSVQIPQDAAAGIYLGIFRTGQGELFVTKILVQ